MLARYGHWLEGVVHGDFGKQIVGEDTVTSEIKRRIGVSLRLLLLGTIFGAVGGVLVGVLGAVRQRKPADIASTFASYVLLASPTVVVIIVVQTLFFLPYVVPFVAGVLIWARMLGAGFHRLAQRSAQAYRHRKATGLAPGPDWIYPGLVLMGLWGIGAGLNRLPGGPQGHPHRALRRRPHRRRRMRGDSWRQ